MKGPDKATIRNSTAPGQMRLLLITPTRNEGKYIRTTLESIVAQTLLPVKWIIVDDGSTDNTADIIREYLGKAPFIQYLHIPDRGYRKPSVGVIEAFYAGLSRVGNLDYDVIAKLDGDLRVPPDMLQKISEAFEKGPQLGITGGTRYERFGKERSLKRVHVPRGFVGGTHKFYRNKCFEDIGGLIKRPGWDGVDTIRANMNGWKTGEIESLRIHHLKPTGTARGEGLAWANEKYGNVSYYMGGYLWYFILRVLYRSVERRSLMIGYYMIKGYLKELVHRTPRESAEFRKYLKREQVRNVVDWLRDTFRATRRRNET